jgi:transposase InsO family protein
MKTSRHTSYDTIRPLPVPACPWQDISWDFVVGLPSSVGYDSVLVVVDRLTKMQHLILCTTKITAEEFGELFIDNIWRLHGLPDTVISHRGNVFGAKFWTKVCKRLGIDPCLSMAFHPKTDGQTERLNVVFEPNLRAYVNHL